MKGMRALLVLATTLAIGACEDVVDPDSVQGTYTLTAVHGDPLPAVAFDGETAFGHLVATATSGSLTLREATYTERIAYDLLLDGDPVPASEPVVINGDYSIDGQILSFEPTSGDYPDFTGSLQGGVLTTVEIDPDLGELVLTWER